MYVPIEIIHSKLFNGGLKIHKQASTLVATHNLNSTNIQFVTHESENSHSSDLTGKIFFFHPSNTQIDGLFSETLFDPILGCLRNLAAAAFTPS